MNKYFMHDGSVIANLIIAESEAQAESLTGLQAMPANDFYDIGWTKHGDEWRPPMPTQGVWEWQNDSWVEVQQPDPEV